jgi:hypothetical protein
MKAYSKDLRIRVLDALDRGTPATRSSRTAVAITFDESRCIVLAATKRWGMLK